MAANNIRKCSRKSFAKHPLPNTAKNSHNAHAGWFNFRSFEGFTALFQSLHLRSDPGCYNNLSNLVTLQHVIFRHILSWPCFSGRIYERPYEEPIFRLLYLFLFKKKINKTFFDRIDPYQVIICPRLHRGPLSILVWYFCLFFSNIHFTNYFSSNPWFTALENDYVSGLNRNQTYDSTVLYLCIQNVIWLWYNWI